MKGRELQSTAHPLADAFQLLVIIGTNSAFAEADLWPEIEVDATLAGLHTNALIKAVHRAFTERGQDLGIADYVIDTGRAASPIIGRLIDKGLHDELTGEAYAVIDGTDGRAHHVRFQGCEASPTRRPPAASSRCAGSAVPTIPGRPSCSPAARTLVSIAR